MGLHSWKSGRVSETSSEGFLQDYNGNLFTKATLENHAYASFASQSQVYLL